MFTAENGHFDVRVQATAKASPDTAWAHLLKIGTWWSSSHSWSGDSHNMSLDIVPGGGFDEKLPGGGCVRHMEVIFAKPGEMLRLKGTLGPLQEHALEGVMTIQLKKEGDSTVISAVYRVSGHFPGGLDQIAPIVEGVLAEQITRLGKRIDGTLSD